MKRGIFLVFLMIFSISVSAQYEPKDGDLEGAIDEKIGDDGRYDREPPVACDHLSTIIISTSKTATHSSCYSESLFDRLRKGDSLEYKANEACVAINRAINALMTGGSIDPELQDITSDIKEVLKNSCDTECSPGELRGTYPNSNAFFSASCTEKQTSNKNSPFGLKIIHHCSIPIEILCGNLPKIKIEEPPIIETPTTEEAEKPKSEGRSTKIALGKDRIYCCKCSNVDPSKDRELFYTDKDLELGYFYWDKMDILVDNGNIGAAKRICEEKLPASINGARHPRDYIQCKFAKCSELGFSGETENKDFIVTTDFTTESTTATLGSEDTLLSSGTSASSGYVGAATRRVEQPTKNGNLALLIMLLLFLYLAYNRKR